MLSRQQIILFGFILLVLCCSSSLATYWVSKTSAKKKKSSSPDHEEKHSQVLSPSASSTQSAQLPPISSASTVNSALTPITAGITPSQPAQESTGTSVKQVSSMNSSTSGDIAVPDRLVIKVPSLCKTNDADFTYLALNFYKSV